MIEINREKCIGCGACVEDCLLGNLYLEGETAVAGGRCIGCGHCVAVCPEGAVSLPAWDMADVEEYGKESFCVKPENYLHAVKFRRSIRSYQKRPVEREKLEQILQAGRYTPTAANRQACRFYVVQETLSQWKELVWRELPGLLESFEKSAPAMAARFAEFCREHQEKPEKDSLFFGADVFLTVAADEIFDGGLAACNMENMAVAEGLGVLYSGYLTRIIERSQALKDWLGISDKSLACCMLLGYPAVHYKRTAPRKPADIIWK
ncbi:MAG: 4Fe-4S binding protein [Lachnospiraceae bacterium]|nr:4Fe-4S binding protein [Lachnospiraceae bacterium]